MCDQCSALPASPLPLPLQFLELKETTQKQYGDPVNKMTRQMTAAGLEVKVVKVNTQQLPWAVSPGEQMEHGKRLLLLLKVPAARLKAELNHAEEERLLAEDGGGAG